MTSGFASSHRLMVMGPYNMAISKARLSFMVTTEAEKLRGLADDQPGLLIDTEQLELGSGLSLDELVAAGQSSADGVERKC